MTQDAAEDQFTRDACIHLWHGAPLWAAKSIRDGGINPEHFKPGCDFGFGHYVCSTRAQAEWWVTSGMKKPKRRGAAQGDDQAAVVRYDVALSEIFAALHVLAFVRAVDDPGFWRFVKSCRDLTVEHWAHAREHAASNERFVYDLVIGPMAEPDSTTARWVVGGQDWDQYVFRTPRAWAALTAERPEVFALE